MSLRVLVVDDSPIIRSIVSKTIQMSGLDVSQVFQAENGLKALQVMRDEWIDIVFADLNMPEMSGQEMVDEMARDSVLISVPVVVISSERDPLKIKQLEERGIRAYMTKPFKPEEFRDVTQEIVARMGGGDRG